MQVEGTKYLVLQTDRKPNTAKIINYQQLLANW